MADPVHEPAVFRQRGCLPPDPGHPPGRDGDAGQLAQQHRGPPDGDMVPDGQVRGLRVRLRPVAGPRPHMRGQLPLGDRPPASSSPRAHPAASPAAASPAPATTGPCPSSCTGYPTTAAATTWTNPSRPVVPSAPPGPTGARPAQSVPRSPGMPQPAAPPAQHAAARTAPPPREHRAHRAIIVIPARQSTTGRDVSPQRIRHAR